MPKAFKALFQEHYNVDSNGAFVLPKELILQGLQLLFEKDDYTFLVDMTAVDYLH